MGWQGRDAVAKEVQDRMTDDAFLARVENDLGRSDRIERGSLPRATGPVDIGKDEGRRVAGLGAGNGFGLFRVHHHSSEIKVDVLARSTLGTSFPGELQIFGRKAARGIEQDHVPARFPGLVLGAEN